MHLWANPACSSSEFKFLVQNASVNSLKSLLLRDPWYFLSRQTSTLRSVWYAHISGNTISTAILTKQPASEAGAASFVIRKGLSAFGFGLIGAGHLAKQQQGHLALLSTPNAASHAERSRGAAGGTGWQRGAACCCCRDGSGAARAAPPAPAGKVLGRIQRNGAAPRDAKAERGCRLAHRRQTGGEAARALAEFQTVTCKSKAGEHSP